MSQVKERPILMSAPMVVATLNGTKTQTRRIVKQAFPGCGMRELPNSGGTFGVCAPGSGNDGYIDWAEEGFACPYGQPGERLWVRETFARVPRTAYACSTGVEQTINPDSDWQAAVYRAGWTRSQESWKPSIHMPRWASRILLEIVSVRVERLQDISEADATAEGYSFEGFYQFLDEADQEGFDLMDEDYDAFAARKGFSYQREWYRMLWQHINGPDSWQANPWVWCITFQRV